MKESKSCCSTSAKHNLTSLNPGEYTRLGEYILETLEKGKDAHMATLCGLMYAFGMTFEDTCRCIAGQHQFHRISQNGTVLLKINPKLVAIDIDYDDLIEIPLDIPMPLSERLIDGKFIEKISELWTQDDESLKYQFKRYLQKLRKDIGYRYTRHVIARARSNILLQDYDDAILTHILKGALPKNYSSGCHYISTSTARVRDSHKAIIKKLFGESCTIINPDPLLPDWNIGPELPGKYQIRKHVIQLKKRFRDIEKRDIDSIIDLFNAYSLYTVTMLYFSTGCRPVIDSFAKLSIANETERLITLADKISTKERALRVVGIPSTVAEQIKNHRWLCGYVSAWLTQLGKEETGKRHERCLQLAYELWLISKGKKSRLHRFVKINKANLLPSAIRPGVCQDSCRKFHAASLSNCGFSGDSGWSGFSHT